MKWPKILIVSQNALSTTGNMGKTIASYFYGFPLENIAQLYFHEGIPNSSICNNYYRFSDADALKSILFRWIRGGVVEPDLSSSFTDTFSNKAAYSLGKKKNPVVYLLRDAVWRISSVINKKIITWIKDFSPDIIFFAAGDYKYPSIIVRKLSKKLHVPFVTCFFDDYYTNSIYKNKFLGGFYYKSFKKEIDKNVKRSLFCFSVSEEMSGVYSDIFNKKFVTLYTSTDDNYALRKFEEKQGISYLGGLSLKRDYQLKTLGDTLRSSNYANLPKHIDVFSPTNDETVLKVIKSCEGIAFHGGLNSDEVKRKIEESKVVLHVESFDSRIASRTKYSISTKIAESLASHTLLVAYGPDSLASMQYLKKNEAAIVSSDIQTLLSSLEQAIKNENIYNRIISNAYNLYLKNHSRASVTNVFMSNIASALDNYYENHSN